MAVANYKAVILLSLIHYLLLLILCVLVLYWVFLLLYSFLPFLVLYLNYFAEERVRERAGPEAIKYFSFSTQLSTKFILLINVKMLIVGILTFISMINTTSERLIARQFFMCRRFSFYEQL